MLKNNKLTITNIIILANVVMFILQNNIEHGSLKFGLNIYFLKYQLWYQPLSTMFVHSGIAHILMNMFVLYQFGNLLEKYRGKITFLILYIGGGILTSFLSVWFLKIFNLHHNLIGASGAICVLLGYYAYISKSERKGMIIWILLISFAPIIIGINIAWYAHIIGFAIGMLMALIAKKQYEYFIGHY